MAQTDSVSVFSEGTFEEQIRELVDFLARSHPEDQRLNFIAPFQEVLKIEKDEENGSEPSELTQEVLDKRKKAVSMVITEVKGFGDGSEKEIEGFFNLVFAYLFDLFPLDSIEMKQHLDYLLDAISSTSTHLNLQYRLLSFLFNSIPQKSGLRLTVYNVLLTLASSRDELEVLQISRPEVEKWIKDWDVTSEQKSEFLKRLTDVFANADEPLMAYYYSLSYLRSLTPSSPEARSTAVEVMSMAMRLPSIFDFDSLFKIEAIFLLQDHELFSLLKVFLSGGLDEYKSWHSNHVTAIEKYNLDELQLERKIRLLTLTSLAFDNVGRDLSYSAIAAALQVEISEVEKWAIDVIRAGLLSGKLSQTCQVLHINRSTSRAFERRQWEALEQRLLAWKTGLGAVLDVVASTRRNDELSTGDVGTTAAAITTSSETAVQTTVAV